jgi:hypothetical protein
MIDVIIVNDLALNERVEILNIPILAINQSTLAIPI